MDSPHWARSFFPLILIGFTGCATSQAGTPAGVEAAFLDGGVVRAERTSANVVTAEQLARYPTAISVEEILQQQVPGLRLRRRNEPGGAMTMHVLGSAGPLFVVDGVPINAPISALGLNPRDIERIEVRKHGNTAEYGLRGSNGVILISTRGR